MKDPPDISVIVPVHNAEATLPATLRAIAAQTVSSCVEVLVVDSASTDASRQIAERFTQSDARFRVIDNPAGEPASSRNLGAAAARGTLLCFTDADCRPDPGWLEAGLAALHRADLVQGRVLPERAAGPWDRTLSVGHESGLYETANLMCRRAVLERVGGFAPLPGVCDPRPFGEDTWFAWRARRAGARTAFASDAVVRHAVVPRPPWAWVAEQRRRGHFAWLVCEVPELRAAFLCGRIFLSPQTARFDLAVAGLIGAAMARRGWPLLAALPYLAGVRHPAQVVGDAVGLGSLLRASGAAHTLVL